MRKIKTILRLHFESKLSQHQIASSIQVSAGAVNKYIKRATTAGLNWPLPAEYEYEYEEKLKALLNLSAKAKPASHRYPIVFADIHREIQRKSVTLQLLWEEYNESSPEHISYNHFCRLYRDWKNTQPKSMRQTHKAGDKAFVNYAVAWVKAIRTSRYHIRVINSPNLLPRQDLLKVDLMRCIIQNHFNHLFSPTKTKKIRDFHVYRY